MSNTFLVDNIEYKIVKNPHTSGPMIARVDGFPIENRKEICRRFLRERGWSDDMFFDKITNDLERQINKIINNSHVPNEIGNPGTKKKEIDSARLHPELTQTEEIISYLKQKGCMTHRELSIALYGDSYHMPNLYESLQSLVRRGIVNRKGERPAYYSLSDNDISAPDKYQTPKLQTSRTQSRRTDIPAPSIEQIEYWLHAWNELEDYTAQEKAIDKLFGGEFKPNDNLQNILIKCSVLNDFYSTNIFKIYPVAKHILSLNIDDRLREGDPTLVDDIAKISIGDKEKNFYSFASKYCSHHNPLEYPIYDSYVHKVLKYYRNIDRFYTFEESDLKNYKKFKNILIEFKKFYHLEKYNLKQLDMYLWQFGKKYFPNKY